jgi:hypothetical protein
MFREVKRTFMPEPDPVTRPSARRAVGVCNEEPDVGAAKPSALRGCSTND